MNLFWGGSQDLWLCLGDGSRRASLCSSCGLKRLQSWVYLKLSSPLSSSLFPSALSDPSDTIQIPVLSFTEHQTTFRWLFMIHFSCITEVTGDSKHHKSTIVVSQHSFMNIFQVFWCFAWGTDTIYWRFGLKATTWYKKKKKLNVFFQLVFKETNLVVFTLTWCTKISKK